MSRRTANFKRGRTSKRLSVDPQGAIKPAKNVTESSDDDSDSGSDSEMFNLGAGTLARMKAALKGPSQKTGGNSDTPGGFFLDKDPSSQKEAVKETRSDDVIPLSSSAKDSEAGPSDTPKPRSRGERSEPQLSSELQVDVDKDVYVHTNIFKDGTRAKKQSEIRSKKSEDDLMKQSVLTGAIEKQHTIPPYQESYNQLKKQRRAEREKTKGKDWYNLPATELTDEKKNDLMVLQYRRALDPKRFYKAPDIRAIPKYFQMGKVVDNPLDFYHSRIPKKQRKKTLVDELLDDQEFRQYNKRKYAEIQETKMKGRKGAFKHMKRLKKKKK